MFGLGGWEIGILVVFGLLFFGPKKLPQLMSQVGKVMREVRKASSEFQYSLERELEDDQYKRAHRRAKKRAKTLAAKEGKDAPDLPPGATAPAPAPEATGAPAAASSSNGNGHAAEPASPTTPAEPAATPPASSVAKSEEKPDERT